jgi:cell division protein FtsL
LLAAPKIKEYDIAKNPSTNNASKEQKKTRTKIRINPAKVKFFLCSLTLLSFIMGLALMSLAANVNTKGQELNSIKRELSSLQIANERLQLEKARMLAPGNIEMIAKNELGMERPLSSNFRMIAVGDIAVADTLTALYEPYDNRALGMADDSNSISIMAAIANAFSGWAIYR